MAASLVECDSNSTGQSDSGLTLVEKAILREEFEKISTVLARPVAEAVVRSAYVQFPMARSKQKDDRRPRTPDGPQQSHPYRPLLSDRTLFAALVLRIAEEFEKGEELADIRVPPQILFRRYAKALDRILIHYDAFYSSVAMCQILCGFTAAETLDVFTSLVGIAEALRKELPACTGAKKRLLAKLYERFEHVGFDLSKHGRKYDFAHRPALGDEAQSMADDLRRFLPTDSETFSASLTLRSPSNSSTGKLAQGREELRRQRQVLDVDNFEEMAARHHLPSFYSSLRMPRFHESPTSPPPGADYELDFDLFEGARGRQAELRRNVRPKTVAIHADNCEIGVFGPLHRAQSFVLQTYPTWIDVVATDEDGGLVTLSTYALTYSTKRRECFSVSVGHLGRLELALTYSGDDEVTVEARLAVSTAPTSAATLDLTIYVPPSPLPDSFEMIKRPPAFGPEPVTPRKCRRARGARSMAAAPWLAIAATLLCAVATDTNSVPRPSFTTAMKESSGKGAPAPSEGSISLPRRHKASARRPQPAANATIAADPIQSVASSLGSTGTIAAAFTQFVPFSLGSGALHPEAEVDTGTGSQYIHYADLVIPGSGPAIEFVRTYSSRENSSGPLGFGWTHSYDIGLITDDAANTVTLKAAGSKDIVFTSVGNGLYQTNTPGVFDVLTREADASFTLERKNRTRFTFSNQGTMLGVADRNGNTLTLDHDDHGRVTKATDSVGRSVAVTYDLADRIRSLIDYTGRVISYQYDASGNLVTCTSADGAVTTYAYDSAHHMTGIVDPGGLLSQRYVYDHDGRVVKKVDALGSTTSFQYDTPVAGTTTVTDPLGNATLHTYDLSTRLVATVDPLGRTESFGYDSNNQLISMTSYAGTTTFTYDGNGNLVTRADPLGNVSTYRYNDLNEIVSMTDALGHKSLFAYDEHGNRTRAIHPDGTVIAWSYDRQGHLLEKVDEAGHSTFYSYDSVGLLAGLTDATGVITHVSTDQLGRPLSITSGDGAEAYRQYTYDAAGRITQLIDRGVSSNYSYDARGNLISAASSDGGTLSFVYDALNRPTTTTSGSRGEMRYGYDSLGNLVGVKDSFGNATRYGYDPLSRIASVSNSAGERRLLTYDANGDVATVSDERGRMQTFTYDGLNRLATMTSLTYDGYGNRISHSAAAQTVAYSWDSRNRLLATLAEPGNQVISYSYDAVGNRLSMTDENGSPTYYRYDALNRLVEVQGHAGDQLRFIFNSSGDLTGATGDLSLAVNDGRAKVPIDFAELVGFGISSTGGLVADSARSRDRWRSGTLLPLAPAEAMVDWISAQRDVIEPTATALRQQSWGASAKRNGEFLPVALNVSADGLETPFGVFGLHGCPSMVHSVHASPCDLYRDLSRQTLPSSVAARTIKEFYDVSAPQMDLYPHY